MTLFRGRVWVFLGLLLMAALGMFYWLSTARYSASSNGLPLHSEAHNFLLAAKGGNYRLSDFRDKVVLIVFGYVNCPDVTPHALTNLSKIYQTLTPHEQPKVQVLMISTNPQRDTPEQVGRYVKSFDPSFIGLTGTPTNLPPPPSNSGCDIG